MSQFAPVALHDVGTADVTLSVPAPVIGPPVKPVPVATDVTVPVVVLSVPDVGNVTDVFPVRVTPSE